jgi:hypothetical protein
MLSGRVRRDKSWNRNLQCQRRVDNRLLMDFEALHIFVRVAELSSFSRASESLRITRAAVSAAVQRLETSLGARLSIVQLGGCN